MFILKRCVVYNRTLLVMDDKWLICLKIHYTEYIINLVICYSDRHILRDDLEKN